MIEILVFILFQLIINFFVRYININNRFKYIFASLMPLFVGLLMLSFPFWNAGLFSYFHSTPLEDYNCGMFLFVNGIIQWVFGIPIVYFLQVIFNETIFKKVISDFS
jgi:hypothetical protein